MKKKDKDKNGILYQEKDGLTIICEQGDKTWWNQDGKRHRTDGPAIEYVDGSKSWWVDGKKYTEEEFNKEISLRERSEEKCSNPHCGKIKDIGQKCWWCGT